MAASINDIFSDAPPKGAIQSCPPEPPAVSKVIKAYFAEKEEGTSLKGRTGPVTVLFKRINAAALGSKVWIIVETADLKDAPVTVEILGV